VKGICGKLDGSMKNRFGKRRCTVFDGKGAKHMVTTHAQNFKNWKGTLIKIMKQKAMFQKVLGLDLSWKSWP
jgi:hypothetical protein